MKITFYILIFITPIFLFSCKKETLHTFGTEHGLYFNAIAGLNMDTTKINFAFGNDKAVDSVVKIPIVLMGRQFDVPTPYKIDVSGLSTAISGTDYELSDGQIFPAKTSTDTLRLKVFRTIRMANTVLSLSLELKPSKGFGIVIGSTNSIGTKINLAISDIFAVPAGWVTTSEKRGFDYYLGTFSKRKLLALVESAEDYSLNDILGYLMNNYSSYFGQILDDFLKERKLSGSPVLEVDGSEMTTGVAYH